ncbi:hypothetical protein OG568_09220 [Streptomyces sp. NBC_01450]|uniref:hypothetical protein n=1 Tax=unclassified Streptomyces TaxID=2593676 RepID=UPI0015EF5545|nr:MULTISPECIES: hypothetical protein [unclassified Streptomyces]KAF5999100.1 hypothetical protein BOG92_052385 [Streptomyces sp. WAC00263]
MTATPLNGETDATRRAIIAAMNRLLAGTPKRSTGRLNVSQLAIEADVQRWHLTHQHQDLKDLFQARVAADEAKRVTHVREQDSYQELKKKHADLQKHARLLEERLQLYATAVNLLSRELQAVTERTEDTAKVRFMPRRPRQLP